jgi:uncharacterized protein RhaS with RHS repeats
VNRHYDPQRGRFAQADPLGMGAASLENPQSLNLYSYVQNDPVNFADPSGLLTICYWNLVGWDKEGILPDIYEVTCYNFGNLGLQGQDNPNRSDKRQKPRAPKKPEKKENPSLSNKECEKLFQKIKAKADELQRRIADFTYDLLNLRIPGNFYERKDPNTGKIISKNGLDTHVDEYYKTKGNLQKNLNKYNKGKCGDRGGGDGTAQVLEYARNTLETPAYIPDYKTGLKSEADSPAFDCCAAGLDCCDFGYPRIFVPGVNPTSVPGGAPAPVRVYIRPLLPLRVP